MRKVPRRKYWIHPNQCHNLEDPLLQNIFHSHFSFLSSNLFTRTPTEKRKVWDGYLIHEGSKTMSLLKKTYINKPMTVSDLDHIYELELECYEFQSKYFKGLLL